MGLVLIEFSILDSSRGLCSTWAVSGNSVPGGAAGVRIQLIRPLAKVPEELLHQLGLQSLHSFNQMLVDKKHSRKEQSMV